MDHQRHNAAPPNRDPQSKVPHTSIEADTGSTPWIGRRKPTATRLLFTSAKPHNGSVRPQHAPALDIWADSSEITENIGNKKRVKGDQPAEVIPYTYMYTNALVESTQKPAQSCQRAKQKSASYMDAKNELDA